MSSDTKTQLVMTLIGRDRPGLVEALARQVEAHGGNWLDARMAQLADHFAGILRVELPAGQVDALQAALADLHQLGVQITLQQGGAPDAGAARHLARLELTGYDRPGIVHAITAALAGHGVNILGLETALEQAPMSGEPTFTARASLQVPTDTALDQLAATLERISHDLMVDIQLEELDG